MALPDGWQVGGGRRGQRGRDVLHGLHLLMGSIIGLDLIVGSIRRDEGIHVYLISLIRLLKSETGMYNNKK